MLVSSRGTILDDVDEDEDDLKLVASSDISDIEHHDYSPPKKPRPSLTLDECLDRGTMPDFDTLTETYVKQIFYREALDWIREDIAGEKLFLTFSTAPGTLSYAHVNFVNVIIGTLSASETRDKIYLINCRQIQIKEDDAECEQEDDFYIQLFYDSMVCYFGYLQFPLMILLSRNSSGQLRRSPVLGTFSFSSQSPNEGC